MFDSPCYLHCDCVSSPLSLHGQTVLSQELQAALTSTSLQDSAMMAICTLFRAKPSISLFRRTGTWPTCSEREQSRVQTVPDSDYCDCVSFPLVNNEDKMPSIVHGGFELLCFLLGSRIFFNFLERVYWVRNYLSTRRPSLSYNWHLHSWG